MGEVYSFFFLRDRAILKKVAHLMDLNCRLVHVVACFKRENAVVFEIRC